MAQLKSTRTVYEYSFNPPQFVSELDYSAMKMKTLTNPSEPLFPLEKTDESLNQINLILGIGIVAALIGFAGMYSSKDTPGWSVILLMLSVFLVIGPILNGGIRESEQNRTKANDKQQQYYINLESMVRDSTNYNQFMRSYKVRYERFSY